MERQREREKLNQEEVKEQLEDKKREVKRKREGDYIHRK